MKTSIRARAAKLCAAFFLTACLGGALAQTTVYTPVPAGFDFPAKEADLLAALKAGDEARLRGHAWMVFAGLTQPARPAEPGSEAVWETWYSGAEAFASGPMLQGTRRLQRNLARPRQFQLSGGPLLQAVGQSQLAFTMFNRELLEHTRKHSFQMKAALAKVNAGWSAATPVKDRKIADYPAEAMSLKLIWMPVPQKQLGVIPVWDEMPIQATAPSHPPEGWKRAVAVDPTRSVIPAGERRDVGQFKDARVVPLSSFYHFQLSAELAQIAGAEEGDYVVLVAMHYTTKEIPNWVWATFWWHDQPDAGKFAAHRPAATVLKGTWRNYLMDVAYDMDLPKESNGTPKVAFNPYLEAGFVNGVNSNCMTCHQRAVWSEKQNRPPFLPITRGAAKPDNPIFIDGTTVDFLWSLLLEGNKP